jgi:hypothetical protein
MKHLRLFAGLILCLLPLCVGAGVKSGCGVLHGQVVKSASCLSPAIQFNFLPGSLPAGITFTRASMGTDYNSAGILTTVANNVPRFDYNPTTLMLNGLLIEQASTNALLSSKTIGDANWTNQHITAVSNSVTGPDGTTSATTITNTFTSFP